MRYTDKEELFLNYRIHISHPNSQLGVVEWQCMLLGWPFCFAKTNLKSKEVKKMGHAYCIGHWPLDNSRYLIGNPNSPTRLFSAWNEIRPMLRTRGPLIWSVQFWIDIPYWNTADEFSYFHKIASNYCISRRYCEIPIFSIWHKWMKSNMKFVKNQFANIPDPDYVHFFENIMHSEHLVIFRAFNRCKFNSCKLWFSTENSISAHFTFWMKTFDAVVGFAKIWKINSVIINEKGHPPMY